MPGVFRHAHVHGTSWHRRAFDRTMHTSIARLESPQPRWDEDPDNDVPMPPDDPARNPPVEEPPKQRPPKRAASQR